MFVDDLVKGFYDVILNNKILILVNYDVDAICAAKILQYILRYDNIVYVLVPIKTVTELKKVYDEQKVDVKHIILINCGGTLDIIDILEPEEDVIFFVSDSHRPTDICNIYSSRQIQILTIPEEDEKIPEFEDVFVDNESLEEDTDELNDDSNNDTVEELQNKSRINHQNAFIKRNKRRNWEEKRKTFLFDYTQFSYYGRSTAILMYDLAWKLHRESIDLLWWGIIGVTEQYILGKTENMRYLKEVELIGDHIGRICESAVNDLNCMSQSISNPPNDSRNSRIESLIASAVLDLSQDSCVVVGIPPITESLPKSFFGKAFEQVARKTNTDVSFDYFDSSIAKMQIKDRPRFFDALTVLLS